MTHHFKSPKSSDIAGAEYLPLTQVLTVTFSRGVKYTYPGVPTATWQAFEAATSKGQFFAKNIKGRYVGTRATGAGQ